MTTHREHVVRLTTLACAILPAIAVPQTSPKIPLCAGLTIVTAITQPEGDYESIKTVESVDAAGVRVKYSTERIERSMPGHPLQKINVVRSVRAADLTRATAYLQEFGPAIPIEVPGTTAIGTSRAVLEALKQGGRAELGMFDMPGGLPTDVKYSPDPKAHPSVFDRQILFKLRRADDGAAAIEVTVNGDKVALPAVHALGAAEWGEKGDFFFLDDLNNPLSLRWRIRASTISAADRATLQVVKIAYRCDASSGSTSRLERQLSEGGSVDVYDIFFSFNSDAIREESEPTLAEIGGILRRHADWNLSIAGHTDGIASDAFNLDLSKRRAAAVKNALIARFGVDARRLTTTGYGKSRPRDTNDTPEGRARNRRVELTRQ